MEVTQFQVEPKSRLEQTLLARQAGDALLASRNLTAAADSLLLGLRMRGWLADSEKVLLDQLAVDNHIAFLLVGDEYVHPESTNLFPIDVIRAAQSQGGTAIFRHYYRPERLSGNTCFIIHTARIGTMGAEPVVLGMFGPEGIVAQDEVEENFAGLVETFRHASTQSEKTHALLRTRLNNDTAAILINRCSGRSVYVNETAVSVLQADPRELVDLEYTHLKDKLAPAFLGFGHTMTNLTIGDQRFVLITRCERAAQNKKQEQSLAGFFIDRCLAKIANCTMAASHLQEVMQGKDSAEEKSLARVILGELGDVGRRLHRFTSLFRYHELPCRTLNPVLELERAIQQVRAHGNKQMRFSLTVKGVGMTIEAPEMALVHLFESVMLSHHLTDSNGAASTHISVQSPADEGRMVATFTTDIGSGGKNRDYHPDWSRYSDELADTMKLSLTRQRPAGSKTMTTTILFP